MSMRRITTRVVIMAKAPQAGQVKTRLVPALGAQGAADLALRMLLRTVNTALAARGTDIESVTVCASPDPQDPAWAGVTLPGAVSWTAQGKGDLGQRMARTANYLLSKGERVLLIGTDLPGLTCEVLQNAARALSKYEACVLPTFDGGYGLLGLRSPQPVFDDMPWSTPEVFALTQERLRPAPVWIGPMLQDIDEPQDLVHWPEPIVPSGDAR